MAGCTSLTLLLLLLVAHILLLVECDQVKGIFNGAAIVFFSYIGFDAVATSAEEVRGKEIAGVLLGLGFRVH